MTAKLYFRTASFLMATFAIGHTIGFLSSAGKPAESIPVLEAMKSVRFQTMGFERTYWDFYSGFGLLLTVFMLMSAFLLWRLGGASQGERGLTKSIARGLFASQVAMAILCATNLFWAPIIFSTLIAAITFLGLRGLASPVGL